jgi:hypothetical protein
MSVFLTTGVHGLIILKLMGSHTWYSNVEPCLFDWNLQ